MLLQWFRLVRDAREDLARIMTAEQGKPLSEARAEIDYAASFIEFYAEEAKRPNIESVTSHLPSAEMELWREPLGVATLDTPWNYPCAMIARKAAAARGARLLTGGGRDGRLGPLFFRPTVLSDVPPEALIFHEETFGPVAAIAPFDCEDQALAIANATEYGLVAYVHSRDPRRIYRLSRALQFGMVAVNRTRVTGAPIPFGSMKQSGLGREGSRHGLEAFTDIKDVRRDRADRRSA